MSRLTRDGTAEPISRDQILRHTRGQGNIIFPVQLTTSRIGNLTWLIHTLLYVMTIHTYIHTYLKEKDKAKTTLRVGVFIYQYVVTNPIRVVCRVGKYRRKISTKKSNNKILSKKRQGKNDAKEREEKEKKKIRKDRYVERDSKDPKGMHVALIG